MHKCVINDVHGDHHLCVLDHSSGHCLCVRDYPNDYLDLCCHNDDVRCRDAHYQNADNQTKHAARSNKAVDKPLLAQRNKVAHNRHVAHKSLAAVNNIEQAAHNIQAHRH